MVVSNDLSISSISGTQECYVGVYTDVKIGEMRHNPFQRWFKDLQVGAQYTTVGLSLGVEKLRAYCTRMKIVIEICIIKRK